MAYRPQYKNKNGDIVDLPLDADTVRGKEVYSKEDTDTRIAEKLDEKQITECNCSHEVEITGFGEEDCNLVIDDQDVVITKIQGQTRRKSLNLINVTTTNTESDRFIYDKELKLSAGTYTIVIYANDSFACEILADNVSLGFLYTNNSKTFTLSNGCSNFKIYVNGLTTNIRVMLNEGSTALPYEPYDNTLVNSKCDFVSTGRNLLPPSCFYPNNNIQPNGSLGTYAGYSSYYKVPVKPNTNYTISYVGDMIYNLGVATYDVNGNFISYETWSNSKGTTANNVYFISFDFPNTYTNVMLNYGDTALPYEPYIEDTMQCGLELGAFDYHDNVNHITHRQTSEMITIDGSSDENWQVSETSTSGKKRFYILANNAYGSTNSLNVASNWIDGTANDTYLCKNCISCDGYGIIIYVDGITTVEALRTWLQSNPITLVYKLATETTEENILPSGYKVWYKGMQVQKTDTIPYILTKQYAISLASQVLNNVSIDRSQQKQIDELKENKLNKSDLKNWSFGSTTTGGVLNYEINPVLECHNDHTIVGNINGNIVLTGAGQRPIFLNDDFEEKEIALLEDVNKKANSSDVYTKQESDAKFLPLAGGTITGNINVSSTYGLMQRNYGWGFNDECLPCVNAPDRTILISTQGLDQDYRYYTFPDKNGTVALLEDIPHLFIHQISFSESALSYVSFEIILSYPTAINTKDKIKAILTDNYYTSIQRPKIAIGMSAGQGYFFDAIYINNGELFARELTTTSASISIEGICVSIEDKITQKF